MKSKKYFFYFTLSTLILFVSSCVSRVAIKEGYDFSKIQRVGVLSFADYKDQRGSGEAVSDEFIRQLLQKNITVIERIELESVIKEQGFASEGYLNPETAKKAGEILGVDVVITGTVTKYLPENQYVMLLDTRKGRKAHRIRIKKTLTASGDDIDTTLLVTNPQVGISARMIDVETGTIVWANSYSYDAFDIDSAIEWAVSDLLRSLKKVWPQIAKKK
ncbi:MAG: CsgG/HfaB family protein [bacterium]